MLAKAEALKTINRPTVPSLRMDQSASVNGPTIDVRGGKLSLQLPDSPSGQHGGKFCAPCPSRGDCFVREALGPKTLTTIPLGSLHDELSENATPLAKAVLDAIRTDTIKIAKPQEFTYIENGEEKTVTGTVLRVPGEKFKILVNMDPPIEENTTPPVAAVGTTDKKVSQGMTVTQQAESVIDKPSQQSPEAKIAPMGTSGQAIKPSEQKIAPHIPQTTAETTTSRPVHEPAATKDAAPVVKTSESNRQRLETHIKSKPVDRPEPAKQKIPTIDQKSTKSIKPTERPTQARTSTRTRTETSDRRRRMGFVAEQTSPPQGTSSKIEASTSERPQVAHIARKGTEAGIDRRRRGNIVTPAPSGETVPTTSQETLHLVAAKPKDHLQRDAASTIRREVQKSNLQSSPNSLGGIPQQSEHNVPQAIDAPKNKKRKMLKKNSLLRRKETKIQSQTRQEVFGMSFSTGLKNESYSKREIRKIRREKLLKRIRRTEENKKQVDTKNPIDQIPSQEIRPILTDGRRTEIYSKMRKRQTPESRKTQVRHERQPREKSHPLILMIPKDTPIEQIAGAITRIAKEKREKKTKPPVEINVSPGIFDQLRKIFAETVTNKLTEQTEGITITCDDKRIVLDINKIEMLEHLFADFESQILLLQLRQCLIQSEIKEATVLCGCDQQNTAVSFEKVSFCQGCHQGYLQQAFFWLITILWYTIYEMALDRKQNQLYTQSYSYEQTILTS